MITKGIELLFHVPLAVRPLFPEDMPHILTPVIKPATILITEKRSIHSLKLTLGDLFAAKEIY